MRRLPFKAMESVEATVRLGNVSRAADELGLTQSAVSNSIRRYENDLGRQLFRRSPRGVTPTELAIRIAEAVATSRELLTDAILDNSADTQMEALFVAVSPTFASRWLAPRAARFRAAMAPIRVQVSSQVNLVDTADLWIRHGQTGKWPGFTSQHLLAETKVPVASPKLVGHGPVSDNDIPEFPLIGVEARPTEWQSWCETAAIDLRPEPQFTFEVTTSCWDAAVEGSGVALGDPNLLRDELDAGDLRVIGTTSMSDYSYFLCRRQGDARPAIMKASAWFMAFAGLQLNTE